MKKYKLIKEYPGSPSLGTILEYKNHWDTKGLNYGCICIKNPEKYFEYWEEIVEKDYEIIEFIKHNQIRKVTYQNGDKITLSPNPDPDSLIWLLNNNYKIHSIKRLSDGEVFTVGDKTNAGNLTGFSIRNNIVITHHNPSGKDLNDDYYLNGLKRIKHPIFTTEDGVDIYEGDKYTSVIKSSFEIHNIDKKAIKSWMGLYRHDMFLFFSSKEKAEEYIINNKPCLSIQEVMNNIEFNPHWSVSEFLKVIRMNLETEVKQKIK